MITLVAGKPVGLQPYKSKKNQIAQGLASKYVPFYRCKRHGHFYNWRARLPASLAWPLQSSICFVDDFFEINLNPVMLKQGDKVPAFSAPDQDGNIVSSKELRGRKYILYFYPKDDTPGCTTEACAIRDDYRAFKKLDVPVFGVSKDSAASHQKFIKKYSLPFPLLVDENLSLIKTFGAYGKKSMYGRTYMGIIRSTFIVNEKGKVEKVYPKVSVKEHAQDLLNYLKSNTN